MSDKRPRPDDMDVGGDNKRGRSAVEESGAGEVSLSIEETNKLRISLGLKPLRMEPQPRDAAQEKAAQEAAKRKEQEAKAAELRARLEAARATREKQAMEARLKAVKTLGEASDDDDDMMAWVSKNRQLEQQRKQEAERKAAEEARKKAAAAKARGRGSDDEGEYNAAALEGLKVKHDVSELGEGETVVVTLADKAILDERGNLVDEEDELENVLLAEEKKRRKAMKAATKEAKPLWEEDGKVRTLLDKYDEDDEETALQLGRGGHLESDRVRQHEEMRKKLALGSAIIDNANTSKPSVANDYMTAAEVAAFQKPKRKKGDKKERRLRSKGAAADDADGGVDADVIASLEAQAAAGGSDLGRRVDRAAAIERAAAGAAQAQEDKRARFDNALQKANWAAQMLRPAAAGSAGGGGKGGAAIGADDEEDDRELLVSLERARRAAQQKLAAAAAATKKEEGKGGEDEEMDGAAGGEGEGPVGSSVEGVARHAAVKREQEEGKPTGAGMAAMFASIGLPGTGGAAGSGQVLTETMEFVRSIPNPTARGGAKAGTASEARGGGGGGGGAGTSSVQQRHGAYDQDGSDMDEDERQGGGVGLARSRSPSAEREPEVKTGTWVTAEDLERAEAAKAAGPSGRNIRKRERSEGPGGGGSREGTPLELADQGITGERAIGRGLAGALNVLNEKGELKTQIEWAGRTNDRSKNATQGLEDVYTGGKARDRVARSVEAALTIRDEYGRVLTPKQRFRQMCYEFHGIFPSKNKVDKKGRKDLEELAIKKAATSEDPSLELDRLRAVQRATGSAYVVLSGKNAGLPLGGPGASAPAALKRYKPDDDEEGGRNTVASPLPKGTLKAAQAAAAGGGGGGGADGAGPGGRPVIGNLTPWLGDKKVEAMYGLQKPPRPPPAAK